MRVAVTGCIFSRHPMAQQNDTVKHVTWLSFAKGDVDPVARTMTLYWPRFVRALCKLPEPGEDELAVTHEAQVFLEQILTGNLSMADVLHLPEEVLDAAWAIILADGRTDVLAEQAQMSVDDNLWFELVRDCLQFDGMCDPAVGSEFL